MRECTPPIGGAGACDPVPLNPSIQGWGMSTELTEEYLQLRNGRRLVMAEFLLNQVILFNNQCWRIYAYLFLNTRYKEGPQIFKLKGKTAGTIYLKRGQLLTSERELSRALRLSQPQIHVYLRRLSEAGFINQQTDHLHSIITIRDYEELIELDPDKTISKLIHRLSPTYQQEGENYIVTITSKPLTQDVTQVDTKKNMGDSNESPSLPSSPKKKPQKSKPEPDPRVREFFIYWAEVFSEEMRFSYVFKGDKEGALIKNLFKTKSLDQLKQCVDLAFKDDWFRRNAEIGIFAAKINIWISRIPKPKAEEPVKAEPAKIVGLNGEPVTVDEYYRQLSAEPHKS